MTSSVFPAVSELRCEAFTALFSGSVFVIHLVVSDERNTSLSHSMAFPAPFENCFDGRGL